MVRRECLDPGSESPQREASLGRPDRGAEPVAQVRIGRRLVERLGQLNPQISGLARELAPLVRRRHDCCSRSRAAV